MSVLDWFRPLDKVLDTVDKAVVDQDLKMTLRAEIKAAELDLRRLAEQTYVAELNSKTIPWVDALHKMGRQILSLVMMLIGGAVLIYLIKSGQELTLETMASILAMSGPAGIYNFVKGRGRAS